MKLEYLIKKKNRTILLALEMNNINASATHSKLCFFLYKRNRLSHSKWNDYIICRAFLFCGLKKKMVFITALQSRQTQNMQTHSKSRADWLNRRFSFFIQSDNNCSNQIYYFDDFNQQFECDLCDFTLVSFVCFFFF